MNIAYELFWLFAENGAFVKVLLAYMYLIFGNDVLYTMLHYLD